MQARPEADNATVPGRHTNIPPWRKALAWLAVRGQSPLRNVATALLLSIVAAALFLAPELFLAYYKPESYTPYWDVRGMAAAWLLAFLALAARPLSLALFLTGLVFLVQISETLFFSYFGVFYGPAEVGLLFVEMDEIVESSAGVFRYLLAPLLVSCAAFAAFWQLRVRFLRQGAGVVFLLLYVVGLSSPLHEALRKGNSQRFEPDSAKPALLNGMNAVSFFLGVDLPKRLGGAETAKTYQPYAVATLSVPEKYHVVVILGESLNPDHMSLFGYERQTTPYLDSIKGELRYKKIFSSAVTTRVSIPMLFNAQYEPDNLRHISSKESNLFEIAKASGFQTAFISTQEMDGLSSALARNRIDVWMEQRQMAAYEGQYDERLAPALRDAPLDWSSPMFLVLNQRSAHSPYANNFPAEFARYSKNPNSDYKQFNIDTYDDAVRYVDQTMMQLVELIKRHSELPVALFYVSDHGQKLGENGTFGHNTLDFTTATVPLVFLDTGLSDAARARLATFGCIHNHYELAKLLAGLLGREVRNPNEEHGWYYLNGNDLMGRNGYVKYAAADLPESVRCRAADNGIIAMHGAAATPSPDPH